MSNIYQGTLGLIGNTPLVELTHVEKAYGLEARLLEIGRASCRERV